MHKNVSSRSLEKPPLPPLPAPGAVTSPASSEKLVGKKVAIGDSPIRHRPSDAKPSEVSAESSIIDRRSISSDPTTLKNQIERIRAAFKRSIESGGSISLSEASASLGLVQDKISAIKDDKIRQELQELLDTPVEVKLENIALKFGLGQVRDAYLAAAKAKDSSVVKVDDTSTAILSQHTFTLFGEGTEIGAGVQAKIYAAIHSVGDKLELVAIRELKATKRIDGSREEKVMKIVGRHDNINSMQFIDVRDRRSGRKGKPLRYGQMPLFDKKDLESLVTRLVTKTVFDATLMRDVEKSVPEPIPVKEREIMPIARACQQAAKGLAHMHSTGVLHRDLKMDNVLLRSQGEAALTDFDESAPISAVAVYSLHTTPAVYPPELYGVANITAVSHESPAADVYALGAMLLISLYSENTSYDGWKLLGEKSIVNLAHIEKLLNERNDSPKGVEEALRTVILKLMSQNPWDRPNAESAVIMITDALDGKITPDSEISTVMSKSEWDRHVAIRERRATVRHTAFEYLSKLLKTKGRSEPITKDKRKLFKALKPYMENLRSFQKEQFPSGFAEPLRPQFEGLASDIQRLESGLAKQDSSYLDELVEDYHRSQLEVP